ncbi:ABC transporter permease [Micromonospora saelicesensis]|uniref:ABC transporter permease protein YtlD n=1 Tax=Micromonospora saelicesensis TaxID=285676 RepID=A0A1C4W460_9ACTN|nr:ABC transporter permease [Micromonospora saelicesensis]RAN94871.1 putative ABC transporter permease protein YtlD [Micromonospora saelicesensis]RAO48085.1 putative ABC transporter permease protein YtlD [Micromonospora saelicesensis]SCE90938.1 NitT/TauT family transport system permease protein [Micromonospora saelicesensis]
MTENSLDTAGRQAAADQAGGARAAAAGPGSVDAAGGLDGTVSSTVVKRQPGGGRPPRPTLGRRAVTFADSLWRPALVLAVFFAAWWFVAAREYVPNYLVPTPGQVWETMTTQWSELARHTVVTLYETVLGFVLAAALGLVTAVAIAYSRTLDKALYPIVLFAQVIPKIAIAPLLVVWFGLGLTPKIILAVLIAFFPVVISGVAGLRSTDPELLDLAATMGAGPWRTFRKIRFPNALPHLMAGLKVAVTLAVVGAVVGEFVGASEGLGYVLLLANGNLDSALLFADLILMSAIGIVLFVLVEIAEALLIPWHASRRAGVSLTTS